MNAHNLERAREALYSIPADLPRDQWVKAGMGFNSAGGDFDTFDTWSALAGSYNAADCRATWKSFKPGRGVGAGSLFGMAKDHGWTEGNARPAPESVKHPPEPPRKPAPGMGASEVWQRCVEAQNSHFYIYSKDATEVPLRDLRVVPDSYPLRIAGTSVAGYLVVPAHAADGSIQSLQFIPPAKGKKLNLPGASMSGAMFTVGELVPSGVIYICEGVATAWSCHLATGAAAVSCFGFGNMEKISADLRQRDPSARLVVVADVGKEMDCDKIATDVNATVAKMPEGWDDNGDMNDLAQKCGLDMLKMLLDAAAAPPKPTPMLKPVSVCDVLTNPSEPPQFIWDGYLPRGVVSLMGAHGGTGKSTIALMLGVCNALGRPLFGINTVQCKTLFVSLEDSAQIVRHRLAFICNLWGINPVDLQDKLHIVDGTENPELFSADTRGAGETTATYFELRKLVQQGNIGLVVVDNASDAYGGDEIQRRQVRAFIRALAEVARLTNCAVMLLAHVDKATSRARKAEGGEGYSGSTAWHNSARSRLFMTRAEDGTLTLEHQKSNLGKLCEPLTLTWPDGGLPMLVSDSPDTSGLNNRLQGRSDDERATALLKLIAEFESRGQYCSPATTARNNVFAMLRSEPTFQKLKLNSDSTKRIVTQCQRAKWIEPIDYKSAHTRKYCQRWALTPEGCLFAGLPAPTAPTAPTLHESAQGVEGVLCGAPTAPTYLGGVGERAHTKDGEEDAFLLAQSVSDEDLVSEDL